MVVARCRDIFFAEGKKKVSPPLPLSTRVHHRDFFLFLPSMATSSSSSSSAAAAATIITGQLGEKGLFNAKGLNNCFTSVVIQSLWHLEAFRERFAVLPAHVHPTPEEQAACVRCALTHIFTHYQFGVDDILPPDALRVALSLVIDHHLQTSKFAMGGMSDAEEALEEVLRFLHCDHINAQTKNSTANLDTTCTPECISHHVFGMQLMDQKVCTRGECGASSDPEMSTCFLYRVYMDELRMHRAREPDVSFEDMLQVSYSQQPYSCPRSSQHRHGACTGPAKAERWLLNQPAVFTLMCAWSSPEPEREDIAACFALLPKRIHPERFMHVVSAAAPVEYRLRGGVYHYCKHYVCIFYSPLARSFVMLDDCRVTRLGAWSDVVAKCCKGKLHPVLFFYERVSIVDVNDDDGDDADVSVQETPSYLASAMKAQSMEDTTQHIAFSQSPSESLSRTCATDVSIAAAASPPLPSSSSSPSRVRPRAASFSEVAVSAPHIRTPLPSSRQHKSIDSPVLSPPPIVPLPSFRPSMPLTTRLHAPSSFLERVTRERNASTAAAPVPPRRVAPIIRAPLHQHSTAFYLPTYRRTFALCRQCGVRADVHWMNHGLCLLCEPPPPPQPPWR
jgi:hypothetical protein